MIAVTVFRDRVHIGWRAQCAHTAVLAAKITPSLLRSNERRALRYQVPLYCVIAIASSAALLRISNVEPLVCTICRFLRSANNLVTVSREVPII